MKKIALALCLLTSLAVTAGCWNPLASWFGCEEKKAAVEVKVEKK